MTTDIRSFPLAWRWLNVNQYVLPEEVLIKLRPLERENVAIIAVRLYNSLKNHKLDKRQFHDIVQHPADKLAQTFLSSLSIPSSTEVILLWDQRTALVTEWDIFLQHWEAFCYPSSDDVLITPPDDSWLLYYFHEEIFWFGHRRR